MTLPWPVRQKIDRRRRSVLLQVTNGTLVLHTPRRIPKLELPFVLRGHHDWITARIDEGARTGVAEGRTLPWRGQELTLRLLPGRAAARREDGELLLGRDCAAGAALRHWYADEARRHLFPRLAHWCAMAGEATAPARLTDARQRWGSYSARTGIVRLNWRLVMLPEELADTVIAHEVAHIRHLHHGPAFHAHLESFCPAARRLRQQLHHWAGLAFGVDLADPKPGKA